MTFEPAPEELEGPRHAMILGESVLTEGTAGAKPCGVINVFGMFVGWKDCQSVGRFFFPL